MIIGTKYKVTLNDLRTVYNIDDLYDFHEALDLEILNAPKPALIPDMKGRR